ncbi:MAG: hypothetical protein QM741_01675 [Rudaea sp.]|uniref:hypothetical protein n=1 Tax=Rudaea sp. TaxID=2136325 RepID=UPI0039E43231
MNSPKRTGTIFGHFRGSAVFLVAILITVALYFPGLSGGYFFDDYPNIVDNSRLHVDSMNWQRWAQAIWSSPSSDLQRPLASLSFALNYFTSGLAPWPMKAVNLGIHLLNGCLLYLLMLRIIARLPTEQTHSSRNRLLAAIVSAIWLLHPINLTPVLYVVQRMESLAQVFVLAGLLFYVEARARQDANTRGSGWRLWVAFPLMLLLGMSTKESAAMLPLYAFILELVLPRPGISKPRPRSLAAFFGVFLLLPSVVGLAWLLPHVLSPGAYASRPFTLTQRLLTEPRVLIDYIGWILAPLPSAFSFYHDTIPVSTSPLSPWTTLPALSMVLLIAIAAMMVRRSRPLVALGILWFLAAHAMTATIIPLELAFEHRNYFASTGLLLTTTDLILPQQTVAFLALPRKGVLAAFLGLCCFSLFLRAEEWSNPLSLALVEATRHPDSPRATYEYARTLVVMSNYETDSPFTSKALDALQKAVLVKRTDVLADVAQIMFASRTRHIVNPEWWASVRAKLATGVPSAENDAAIKTLTDCVVRGLCPVDDDEMLQSFLAAVGTGAATPAILYSYAIFAFNRLHDAELALRLAEDAANQSHDPQYRLNLANYLIDLKKKDAAITQLSILKQHDHLGRFAADITEAERRLQAQQ